MSDGTDIPVDSQRQLRAASAAALAGVAAWTNEICDPTDFNALLRAILANEVTATGGDDDTGADTPLIVTTPGAGE